MPVCCTFNFEIETEPSDAPKENTSLNEWIQYKWNPNLKESFLHKFRDLYNNFQEKLRDTEVSVSALLPDFIDLYQNAVSSMKRIMIFKVKSTQNASWWDKECSKAKY